MKKRILTGIQSSGKPHLGNILGAILPAIELSKSKDAESFFFIADLHSLTTIKDGKERKEFVNAVAATWLALGFDTQNNSFYRQSDIPYVTELNWYLNCFTPFPMLANAHSFKDKSEKLADVNAGLFTYPVLMACDILLYDANLVPVGRDQLQHLEITRDIAHSFNAKMGETFVVPESQIRQDGMLIPGTDGQKMSKSYHNYIDIFLPEKELKKVILSIQTDSTPLEEPKNPDTCIVFKLFSLLASHEQILSLKNKYLAGGFGYGHAKNELLSLILDIYKDERLKFNQIILDESYLQRELEKGALKANTIAEVVIKRVKSKLGF